MKKLLSSISLFALLCMFSCQNGKEDIVAGDPDAPTKEEVAALDALPTTTSMNSETVILPNGERLDDYLREVDSEFHSQWRVQDAFDNLGPQAARNLLIARLAKVALNLTDRSKYQKPDEGTNRPKQNGLAYLWGGRNHQIRQKAKQDQSTCQEELYGLDCSGFIYQLFLQSGVTLPNPLNANNLRQASVLQQAISSNIPALKKVKVEDLGEIPTNKMEAGDIIYWLRTKNWASHIGIVLKDASGRLVVFMSSGVPGTNKEECDKNRGTGRGPRFVQLNDPYWFGKDKSYGITRINAEISGKWGFFLRCAGASTDALSFSLTFPTTSQSEFEVTGTGTDYDGLLINCKANFKYDNVSNTLTGTTHITKPDVPDFYRYDTFSSVKLSKDETGYFSMTLGDSQNAGCSLEGRLKNNE